MTNKAEKDAILCELNEADKVHITEIFLEKIAPKLHKLDARIGVLNCDFAGQRYKHWNARFRSVREDFKIVEFEYDEDGSGVSLNI
jgi:hypothetical protein